MGKVNSKINKMSLSFCLTWGVPRKVLYNALLDEMEMSKTCRCKANIDKKEGGSFDFYGGKIHGVFTKLEQNKLIEQDWKMNDWENFSKVRFELQELDDDETQLKVVHTNLPASMTPENMKAGWMGQIFDPMTALTGLPILERS